MTSLPRLQIDSAIGATSRSAAGLLLIAALAMAPTPAHPQATTSASSKAQTFSLEGSIALREDGDLKKDREVRFAVVYFEPLLPVAVEPVAHTQTPSVSMVRKTFVPRVQAVPVGSTVTFPNNDRILHNVFSLSGENRFDLGLYRKGETEETAFDHPGIVKIFCNVHHSMVAYLVVLETPFHTQPSTDGRFRLEGLPAGPGRLTVWHERASSRVFDIIMNQDSTLDLTIDITKPRIPPHRNKFGKPYKRSRRGKAY